MRYKLCVSAMKLDNLRMDFMRITDTTITNKYNITAYYMIKRNIYSRV